MKESEDKILTITISASNNDNNNNNNANNFKNNNIIENRNSNKEDFKMAIFSTSETIRTFDGFTIVLNDKKNGIIKNDTIKNKKIIQYEEPVFLLNNLKKNQHLFLFKNNSQLTIQKDNNNNNNNNNNINKVELKKNTKQQAVNNTNNSKNDNNTNDSIKNNNFLLKNSLLFPSLKFFEHTTRGANRFSESSFIQELENLGFFFIFFYFFLFEYFCINLFYFIFFFSSFHRY
jgi:hypothetical protein